MKIMQLMYFYSNLSDSRLRPRTERWIPSCHRSYETFSLYFPDMGVSPRAPLQVMNIILLPWFHFPYRSNNLRSTFFEYRARAAN